MKRLVPLLPFTLAMLFLTLAVAPHALAQPPYPTAAAQGSIRDGVYTWPQAGFSLSLPPLWLRTSYKWREFWGATGDPLTLGARYTNEWVYTPDDPTAREETLLTIAVYEQAAWEAMAAQGGPLPSVAGQANGLVYTMRTPQSDPFPQGSADSQRFRDLSAALAPALSRITILNTASQPGGSTVSSTAFTQEALKNATYIIPGLPSSPVTLTNGVYQAPAAPGAASQIVVTLSGPIVVGTLNGQPAAAVILTANTGGSGTFYYLAVMADQGGKPVNVATSLLGDRIRINGLSIVNNQIVVDMMTQGPNEPLSAATLHQVRKYELQGGQLVRVN